MRTEETRKQILIAALGAIASAMDHKDSTVALRNILGSAVMDLEFLIAEEPLDPIDPAVQAEIDANYAL